MCVGVHTHVPAGRPEAHIGGSYCIILCLALLSQAPFLNLGAHLTTSKPQGSSCLCLPQHWGHRHKPSCLLCMWVLEA